MAIRRPRISRSWLSACSDQLRSVETDAATGNHTGVSEVAHDRHRSRALAATGFADESVAFSRHDAQRHVGNGDDGFGLAAKLDPQIADLEQRLLLGRGRA